MHTNLMSKMLKFFFSRFLKRKFPKNRYTHRTSHVVSCAHALLSILIPFHYSRFLHGMSGTETESVVSFNILYLFHVILLLQFLIKGWYKFAH